MIDKQLLIHQFDYVQSKLSEKGVTYETLNLCRNEIQKNRQIQQKLDDIRHQQKVLSRKIASLFKDNKKEEADTIHAQLLDIKKEEKKLHLIYKKTSQTVYEKMLLIPNLPHPEVPIGIDETSNKILKVVGYTESKYKTFSYKPHWEIGEHLGIMQPEYAAKISGAMFNILYGDGAKLMRALINYSMEQYGNTYEEWITPHLVNTATFTATGHLPKFHHDAYQISDIDTWLIPTGEVPLTGLHQNQILPYNTLPRNYMTHTACFRRESGSAGKDTRGLQRLHEFHKVELVKFCTPEQGDIEHAKMTEDIESVLQSLNLPYRILELCTGDLTFSSARIWDIEVYSPGVNKWLEVSSVGLFTDFQARRGNIRYRDNKSKIHYLNTINGSGMATPRIWAAIIEHNQQPNGTVQIPDVLQNYMKKTTISPSNHTV